MLFPHDYRSECGKFGLRISEKQQVALISFCQQAGGIETGGILLGRYIEADSCALVTSVTGPPRDSKRTRFTFQRGVHGLQRLLDQLWRRNKAYYLGEWHYHPAPAPTASAQDNAQMQEIAGSEKYGCPEPLLLIASWGDNSKDLRLSVSVHRSNHLPLPLKAEID
ncbi:Mov34/MPN/PAD-1 family protein [Rhodopirellula baltica]|uniref:Mov34/MPN/PAD-1 family protein n=1 Tax=Rhodopirellula baltica TaxID=265606 RepID=UPI00055DC341